MSLLRQGRWFVLVGAAQWVVDWSAMVLLSHAGVGVVRSASDTGGVDVIDGVSCSVTVP